MKLAMLLTVHNRKYKTLACIESLYSQTLPYEIKFVVFLVDDGCTDGTSEIIRERFPQVRLLHGNGNLFWNGGMRLAFGEALKEEFDYYLWLNDDVQLYSNALICLLSTSQMIGSKAIIVGSLQDLQTGVHTYGGVRRSSCWRPLNFSPVVPQEDPVQVDTMNGNCVLIPAEVAQAVGNLDPLFTHGMGDFDYGLRAKKMGFEIWLAPGYVGICNRNDTRNTWVDTMLPLHERWRKVREPKGLPPHEWMFFARRHAGLLWPIFWFFPYVKLVVSSFLKGGKFLSS